MVFVIRYPDTTLNQGDFTVEIFLYLNLFLGNVVTTNYDGYVLLKNKNLENKRCPSQRSVQGKFFDFFIVSYFNFSLIAVTFSMVWF